MIIANLLDNINQVGITDIFITDGATPFMRVNNTIIPIKHPPIPYNSVTEFREAILPAISARHYKKFKSADISYITKNSNKRYRINFFSSQNGDSMACRPIKDASTLSLEELHLPSYINDLALMNRGIIIVCGATGSGKSTTMATMINHISKNCRKHILTLEDPIEFVYKNNSSLITQRELGINTPSWAGALRDAMRENPDCIVIGEMRDLDTIQAAINAALTGHLVITTVHTGNTILAIERIINLFPSDQRNHVAEDFAEAFLGIIGQRLLPLANEPGLIPAIEYLPSAPRIKKLVSQRNFAELEKVLHEANIPNACNFTHSVFKLFSQGKISLETAKSHASNPDEFMLLYEGMQSGVDAFKRSYGEKTIEGKQATDLSSLLYTAIRMGSSDLILTVDTPPSIRINGTICTMDLPPLRSDDTSRLLHSVLTNHQRVEFEENKELDFALAVKLKSTSSKQSFTGRFRINAFYQRGAIGIVARVINSTIPSMDTLGLPAIVGALSNYHQGLVLVTGPTGSGKSTTLACMIDMINQSRAAHIITIEDPIEFVHSNKKSIIEQRELNSDTLGFATAIKHALRQDPDVILVGELRDTETIAAALTAAETGHLVLATIHTNNSPQTIDRIVDSFPNTQQNQIKLQLAGVLAGVISQQLIPKKDGSGRVAAFETMIGTSAVQALIREGKTHLLKSTIETNYKNGMITMEHYVEDLVANNIISQKEADKIVILNKY